MSDVSVLNKWVVGFTVKKTFNTLSIEISSGHKQTSKND